MNSSESNGNGSFQGLPERAKQATLLVIDDEPNVVFSIKETLSSPNLAVISAATGRDGIEQVRQRCPNAVILDIRLPDQSGLDVYERIRQIDPRLPVIMMTAFAKTDTAIEAMSRGAYEYLIKPVDFRQLKSVVAKALELSQLSRTPAMMPDDVADESSVDKIIGHSAEMQEVYKKIGRIASQESTVLILGESGTGKELVARAIYQHSNRRQMPFLAINCAALPATILESELFGHERGAFTGAEQRRIGKFEQANGGTIFLDEIGDMSPATQAMALRLLQEQQFERVGGNDTITTDVRIIAATNRDLGKDVAEGRFRQDLFYRLNGFTIQLPPLRDRPDDIPALAEHFVRVFNRDLGKSVRTIDASTMEVLQRHPWPGNVREFQSAIRYAMVHTTGGVLLPECLPETCFSKNHPSSRMPVMNQSALQEINTHAGPEEPEYAFIKLMEFVRNRLQEGTPDVYRNVIHEVDRHMFYEVMKHFHGNQLQAAERLGISRMTLRSKLRALGMIPDRSHHSGDRSEPS